MRRRRPHRPLPALALGILLGGAAGLLSGCDDSPSGSTVTPASSTTPAPAASAAPAADASFTPVPGGPRIEFARMRHDFGVITDTKSHRTTFTFRNVGDSVLQIKDIKAACGCTVPVLAKRQYLPGEGGEIEVVFDPKGKEDKTDKTLTVISNSATGATTELGFTSMIHPLVSIERLQRIGNVKLGTDFRHVVPIYYRDPDLRIDSVSVTDENGQLDDIHATVLNKDTIDRTGDDGVLYRADIEVTVSRDRPWGMLFATKLSVDVNGRPTPDADPIDFNYTAFLMGSVFGEIHAQPGIISFGAPLSPGDSYSKSIQLFRPNREPFKVTSVRVVESTMPGLTPVAEPVTTGRYDLKLEGNVGSFHGRIRGMLSVATDVPGEEELRIPFSGQVQ